MLLRQHCCFLGRQTARLKPLIVYARGQASLHVVCAASQKQLSDIQKPDSSRDTIVALSSGSGCCGVSVIRVSGPLAGAMQCDCMYSSALSSIHISCHTDSAVLQCRSSADLNLTSWMCPASPTTCCKLLCFVCCHALVSTVWCALDRHSACCALTADSGCPPAPSDTAAAG